MSENETAAEAAPAPPDIVVSTKQEMVNGHSEERFVVKFGLAPLRVIEVAELDLGAQFDLAEVTGSTAQANVSWHNMAYIAASVRMIDGAPTLPPTSKRNLRDTLTKMGTEGMKAAGMVLAGYRGGAVAPPATEETHRAVVGNS